MTLQAITDENLGYRLYAEDLQDRKRMGAGECNMD